MLGHSFDDARIAKENWQSPSIKLLFARMYCIDKDDFFYWYISETVAFP